MRLNSRNQRIGIRLATNRATSYPSGGGSPVVVANIIASGVKAAYVTATRASAGLYYNSTGVLTTALTDAVRIDYNPANDALRGLLIEGALTNLLQRSQEFDNAYWTVAATATITANSLAAPDGTTTAETFASTGAAARLRRAITVSAGSQVFSIFAKAGATNFLRFQAAAYDPLGTAEAYFNLGTGAVGTVGAGATASIQSVGDGWYRCSIMFSTTTDLTGNFDMYPVDGDNNATTTSGNSIYIWQADAVSVATFPTSPIPTTTASATRAADVVTVSDLTDISFSATTGTLYFQGRTPEGVAEARCLVALNDNTGNETIRLYMNAGGALRAQVIDGGVTQADLALGTLTAGQSFKAAISYAANDIKGCLNGGTVQTDASATLPTVDRMMIGRSAAGETWCGHVLNLSYYPSAQNTQALTA